MSSAACVQSVARVMSSAAAGAKRWNSASSAIRLNQQAIGDVFPNGMQIARHIIDEDDGKGAAGMQCVNDRPFGLFGGKQRIRAGPSCPAARRRWSLEPRRHGCQENDVGLFRKSVERFDHAVERRLPQLLGLEEFLDQPADLMIFRSPRRLLARRCCHAGRNDRGRRSWPRL